MKNKPQSQSSREGTLLWYQLSLIGVGSVIGAGFFLGTGVSIRIAGPALLIGYLIGGLVAYLVYHALADMSVYDPQPGSFRTYARKAFGPYMGFMSGWIYWVAGVLIMSSEIVALSVFTRFWLPGVPLWIFSVIYSVLGLGVIGLGTGNFGKIESLFGLIKLCTLVVFIGFGLLITTGLVSFAHTAAPVPSMNPLFPNGLSGLWSALVYVLFSYGGIEVLGVASNELKYKKDAPKAGTVILASLTAIYACSLYFVFRLVNWREINESRSPFVTALLPFHLPFLDSFFNLIIISAAFSTMVGTLFTITQVMVSLSQDGDAPQALSCMNKRNVPLQALLMSASGLAAAICFSFWLQNTIYAYFTTAAGLLLIMNWIIILASYLRNHSSYRSIEDQRSRTGQMLTCYTGIGVIILVVMGSLLRSDERIGCYVALGIVAVIGAACAIKHIHWNGWFKQKAR